MKKIFLPVLLLTVTTVACKKTSSSNSGGQGTIATVTFNNTELFDKRVIVTGTGNADTTYPFPNSVLDIDVLSKSTVTKTDIPAGKRKLVVLYPCRAQQTVNATCTLHVYRSAEYLASKTYTELLK